MDMENYLKITVMRFIVGLEKEKNIKMNFQNFYMKEILQKEELKEKGNYIMRMEKNIL